MAKSELTLDETLGQMDTFYSDRRIIVSRAFYDKAKMILNWTEEKMATICLVSDYIE